MSHVNQARIKQEIEMTQTTHREINLDLVGRVLEIEADHFARVSLVTNQDMIVDKKGLIHGGFTFGLADYTAMIAVNHPNVVLISAQVQFVKPVRLGDILLALGRVEEKDGQKRVVQVEIRVADKVVFYGKLDCLITEKHVLN